VAGRRGQPSRTVEGLGTSGSLYPKNQAGLAKALGWWIEKGSFMNAVCLTIGNMPGFPQELIDERRPIFRVDLNPEVLRPKRALYLQRVNAHIAWLAEILADGRKFILGTDPSAADLSAYHPIWFARQNGGSEVNELIAFPSVIDPWYKRIAAIGHGNFSEMTPEQAIDIARDSVPSEPHEWSPEAQNVGLRRGDWVSVTPDDYGNSVFGSLLSWTPDEIVIRHEDISVGKVNLRFPRVGFDAAPAQKQAA
jgi:glutathione S-transferase